MMEMAAALESGRLNDFWNKASSSRDLIAAGEQVNTHRGGLGKRENGDVDSRFIPLSAVNSCHDGGPSSGTSPTSQDAYFGLRCPESAHRC